MSKFGKRLQELRQDNDETQKALAEILNISPRMISYFESGAHFPRDEEIIKKLAAHFHVTTDYLLGYSGSEVSAKLTDIYNKLPPAQKKEAEEYLKYLLYKSNKK